MKSDNVYYKLKDLFYNSGLNLIRRIRISEYELRVTSKKWVTNLLQDAKSVILVGFAGREFWNVLQAFLKKYPEFESTREDLIDDYTILRSMSAAKILEEEKINYIMAFPFGSGYLYLILQSSVNWGA
jgi:hypothetical protein